MYEHKSSPIPAFDLRLHNCLMNEIKYLASHMLVFFLAIVLQYSSTKRILLKNVKEMIY